MKCAGPLWSYAQTSKIFNAEADDFIESLEKELCAHFNQNLPACDIGEKLLEKLANTSNYQCCPNFNKQEITKLYIRTRIFYAIKYFNRDIKSKGGRDKFFSVSHLWAFTSQVKKHT